MNGLAQQPGPVSLEKLCATLLAWAEKNPAYLEERVVDGVMEKWVKVAEIRRQDIEAERDKLVEISAVEIPEVHAESLVTVIRETQFAKGYTIKTTIDARLARLDAVLKKFEAPK